MEWILYALFVIIGLIILYLICKGIVFAIDNWGVETEIGEGKVVGKRFEEAHTENIVTYNVALKMPMITSMYYDDEWSLEIEMESHDDCVNVSEQEYKFYDVGDWVKVIYKHGRLTGDVYMKRVESRVVLD